MSENRSGADIHNGAIALDSEMPMSDIYLFLVLIVFNYINIRDIGKRLLFFLPKEKSSVLFL